MISPGPAAAVAAITAAAVLWVLCWPWKKPGPVQVRLAWILALAIGIYVGCALLGERRRWPPREDRERLLIVLLPLTLAIEGLGAGGLPRWPMWLLRVGLAASAAPILLYNTTYLANLAGPNSADWSRAEAALILSALAAMLAAVWGLLAFWQTRTSDRSLAPVLVLTTLAAGVTVMLSGYYKGGLLGFPLAAALAGAVAVSLALPSAQDSSGFLGVALVGLFSILVMGRFFAALPTSAALCLGLAPLLVWIPEIATRWKVPPGVRAALRMALVTMVLALVVARAGIRFKAASESNSGRHKATPVRRSIEPGP